MYQILDAQELGPQVKMMQVRAPAIANKAKPGQFAILTVDEKGERIPLTLVDWEKEKGTITLVFQEVGVSTRKLGSLQPGDGILNILGPLGNSNEAEHHSTVAVVCGGVGTAAAYPVAKGFKEAEDHVITIMGARNENLLILEDKMKNVSDELYISTDDGSRGHKGFVSDVLKSLIEKDYHLDSVYAVGPPLMMRAAVEVTRPCAIKTVVSLNPIMVDGMGMCGACRVCVGGKTKFACIDGPEFDGHQVDFTELINRLMMYKSEERLASEYYAKHGRLDLWELEVKKFPQRV